MTVAASILGAAGLGNRKRRSSYQEIEPGNGNSAISRRTGFKWTAVVIFTTSFVAVCVLCLSYQANTVHRVQEVVLRATAPPSTSPPEQEIIVELTQGSLQGVRRTSRGGRDFLAFHAIPYAKPPLGDLRFKPPEEAEAWEGVRNGTAFATECIQIGKHDGSGGLRGTEDCLYLNVFTPKKLEELGGRRQLFPVMFYIHGGGLAGNVFPNQPDYLLDENVILVTSHYRLGILGNLNTFDSEARGNQGLKDQVEALRWVKDNIQSFGGNANKVTLFGNSYGAMAVSVHLLSPMSAGLFHRIICQSGNILDPAMTSPHPRVDAFNFGSQKNCSAAVEHQNSTELVACLRRLPADQLVITTVDATSAQIFLTSVEPPSPSGDESDVVLPEQPLKLLQAGKINKVPAIFGVNSAEGIRESFMILNVPEFLAAFNDNFTETAATLYRLNLTSVNTTAILDSVHDFYFGSQLVSQNTKQNLTDMFSDRNFVHPTYLGATFHLNSNNSGNSGNRGGGGGGGRRGNRNANSADAYLYYLTKQVETSYFINFQLSAHFNVSVEEQNGAGHVDELQFLFPYSPPFPIISPDHVNFNFSRMMVRLWTSFADTGKPAGSDNGAEWLPIKNPKPFSWFQIDDEPKMTDFVGDRMNFWDTFDLNDLYV